MATTVDARWGVDRGDLSGNLHIFDTTPQFKYVAYRLIPRRPRTQVYRPSSSVFSVTSVAKTKRQAAGNRGKGKPQRSQRPRRLRQSERTSNGIGDSHSGSEDVSREGAKARRVLLAHAVPSLAASRLRVRQSSTPLATRDMPSLISSSPKLMRYPSRYQRFQGGQEHKSIGRPPRCSQ